MRKQNHKSGKLRIIGGEWRSRRIGVPSVEGLRPTPDSIRETVFNWLAPVISGTNCLDLFCGTGALGIEALSRGAQHTTFVDKSHEVTKHIQSLLFELSASERGTVIQANANNIFHVSNKPYDIIFLDPPFHQGLLEPTCAWLEESDFLTDNCYIYIEAERKLSSLPTPENWRVIREKTAGQVAYYLIWREGETT